METTNVIVKQIKADMYNIQVMIDMLHECKKTRYTSIQNAIRQLVKQIRYQKNLISDKVFQKHFRHAPALFEVPPSEIEQEDITNISSFFGFID